MARGVTLGSILTSLRAEIGASLSVAHNVQVRATHINHLQRVQEMLIEDYTWPHMRVDRYLQPQSGQRYYDPTAVLKTNNLNVLVAVGDMKIDQIESIWLRYGNIWKPVHAGISQEHYTIYDSDTDQRSWPVQRWKIAESEQIELWPIPNVNGDTVNKVDILKVVGMRNAAPLVEDADRAELDDRLIVLMAAAEILGGEQGQKKASLAQRRLVKVRGNLTTVRRFRLFGRDDYHARLLRGPPTVYYRTITPTS